MQKNIKNMIYIRPNERGSSMRGFIPAQCLYGKQGRVLSTDKCYRCFGGILFLEKKDTTDEDVPATAVIAFHITPGSRSYIRTQRTELLAFIGEFTEYFDVKRIARCGGNILNKQNEFLFQEMRNKIEGGLKKLFPGVVIEGVYPNEKTYYMEMVLINHPGDELEFQIFTGETG